jgi:ABC-type polysaccharide/polyol phosphate transport system ATPase subunit
MRHTGLLAFDAVSKRFHRGTSHDSLRDLIPALLGRRRQREDFWAVRDVSFRVEPGEVLGIIGHNGAGKSTILKLLNRIIEPTSGRIESIGRVGSLIEVSAGFHQDLTGRQNVFLQGAIMGMSKAEIMGKFSDIVEFAGMGAFIDTPVKRYSSGMNARLGFSIAAHLEPDVLIIDEVLAVGDHSFQTKAFNRLKAMADSGAPVVLVSHQMDKVAEISTKAILLERGQVKFEGRPGDCIREYLYAKPSSSTAASAIGLAFSEVRPIGSDSVESGELLEFEFSCELQSALPPRVSIALRVISTNSGVHVYSILHDNYGVELPKLGAFTSRVGLQMNLPEGGYLLEVALWDPETNVDLIAGPRTEIRVFAKRHFWGSSDLSARWQLTADP